MRPLSVALAGLVLVAAAARAADGACPLPGQHRQASIELFFGLSMPHGNLPAPRWTAFEDAVLARHLPRGFTVFDASGAWQDASHRRTAHEKTKVVLAVLPPDEAASAVEGIVRGFKALLPNQQSVGVVSTEVCAVF